MSYYRTENLKKILGRKLEKVVLSGNKDNIELYFQDGGPNFYFWVEADCCSSSWIEHLELPGNIEGAVLLSVADSDNITQNHESSEPESWESICVYNTSFKTDKGEIVLEYRNSSNGYYGGSLVGPCELGGVSN